MNPSQPVTIGGVTIQQKLPTFGGGAQDDSVEQVEQIAERDESPDVVLRDYPLERKEIEEFKRAYEAFLTPADLKDTMAGYFPIWQACEFHFRFPSRYTEIDRMD